MVFFENQSTLEFENLNLETIVKEVSEREVEVYVVEDKVIEELNLEYRGKRGITDVLSFPCEAVVPNLPLGSIVMSATLIAQKAEELHHSLEDELKLLFIHGLLHLLGFDHEVDDGEHRAKEQELIQKFSLPLSLIVRNS